MIQEIDKIEKVANDEKWLELPDTKGDYWASNYGRIISMKKGYPVVLKQMLNNMGYYCVSLCLNNKPKQYKVHRLVASVFVGGRTSERNEIDHIDGNPKNNYFKNLRWVTHSENLRNPLTIEKLRPYKIGVTPTNAKAVLMYDMEGNFIKEFPSCRLANLFVNGKDTDKVNACCRGEKKSYCGYRFKFKY